MVEGAGEWRGWLEANHATAPGVWLVRWQQTSGRPAVSYEAAVEEALCFGWVDTISKRLDEERTQLLFTPRRPGSNWSESNRARLKRLIAGGRMTPAGLAVAPDGPRHPHGPAVSLSAA